MKFAAYLRGVETSSPKQFKGGFLRYKGCAAGLCDIVSVPLSGADHQAAPAGSRSMLAVLSRCSQRAAAADPSSCRFIKYRRCRMRQAQLEDCDELRITAGVCLRLLQLQPVSSQAGWTWLCPTERDVRKMLSEQLSQVDRRFEAEAKQILAHFDSLVKRERSSVRVLLRLPGQRARLPASWARPHATRQTANC